MTDEPTRSPPPDEPPRGDRDGLTRRQFLPRATAGAAGLVAAGAIGYELHSSASGSTRTTTTTATTPSSGVGNAPAATADNSVLSFITRPDLHPPAVKVNRLSTSDVSPPYILLSANNVVPNDAIQQGLMLIDRDGRLVWFEPITTAKPFDLNAQIDRGKPVLTWWQGHLVSSHGAGVGMAIDQSYGKVQQIQAGNGLKIDLHELNLTSRGTALITAYEATRTSLRPMGGKGVHPVFAGHAQEIDLATGKVLLDWNSLDHVSVGETYAALPQPGKYLDYMHLNSVSETSDGNLLVSGRNTSALYKLDRSTGKIIWRLNGRKSDFHVAGAARFHWQHDSRAWSDTAYTVFDNGANGSEKRSRGLLLDVNESARTVGLTQAFMYPAAFVADALGSVTMQPDGRVFVGWGDQPYFSDFAPDGTLLLDGQLPINVRSYRALPADWVGRPTTKPTVVARQNPAGGFVLHVSWNGATEVDQWKVLGGPSSSRLELVGSQPWGGFETAIVVNSRGPAFCVVAVDKHGSEIGRSKVM